LVKTRGRIAATQHFGLLLSRLFLFIQSMKAELSEECCQLLNKISGIFFPHHALQLDDDISMHCCIAVGTSQTDDLSGFSHPGSCSVY